MNNNTIESIEWHKDQLAKLLSDEDDFGKVDLMLDSILEKTKTKKKVLVRRGGKIHRAYRWVGSDDNPDVKLAKKLILKIHEQAAYDKIEVMAPDDVLPVLKAALKAYETEEPDEELVTPHDELDISNAKLNLKHLIKYLSETSHKDRLGSRDAASHHTSTGHRKKPLGNR